MYVVLFRLVDLLWFSNYNLFFTYFLVGSILSIGLGSLGAFFQGSIKRLIGYSTISHAGYILLGVLSSNLIGVEGVLFYLVFYSLINVIFFCIFVGVSKIGFVEGFLSSVSDFKAFRHNFTLISFILLIVFYSILGIPPFPGFFSKLFIFVSCFEEGLW